MASSTLQESIAGVREDIDLEALKTSVTLETLEQLVARGFQTLEILKIKLSEHQSSIKSLAQWTDRINKLTSSAKNLPKTIIGVFGGTGAGKSFLINALLDQERLVPTNCMRACTSVVTEISYNHGKNFAFRGVVEFLSREDWEQELDLILSEMRDDDGEIRQSDITHEKDSLAAVAYAKVKAVYMGPGGLTKDDLKDVSKEDLMVHERVSLLGQRKLIRENCAKKFYAKLQAVIDSTDSTNDEEQMGDLNSAVALPTKAQYWPLIKLVRIYVKHKALETGAVIVDLPGSQDSNTARARMAEKYLAQCTGMWIVAPITRAVDNQAAKELLGQGFKRQLQMDNSIGAVTFICSKTDEIMLNEATDTLHMKEEFGAYQKHVGSLHIQQEQTEQSMSDLRQRRTQLRYDLGAIYDQLDLLMETRDRQRQENDPNSAVESTKRKRTSDSPHHLTSAMIKDEMSRLTQNRNQLRQQEARVTSEIQDKGVTIDQLMKSMYDLEHDMQSKCILRRNDFAKQRVQSDFAAGVRDIDEEIAEEKDAANFDPEESLRDYEAIKADLPVFCVSALAYQKSKGRLAFEKKVSGFENEFASQIPQLQDHCRSLTLYKRRQAAHTTLAEILDILYLVDRWASAHVSDRRSEAQHEIEVIKTRDRINALKVEFDAHRKLATQSLHDVLKTQLSRELVNATKVAANEANVHPPSAPYWSTYRAICRRGGVFINAGGRYNWNHKLVYPIMRTIGRRWEITFQNRMPAVLDSFLAATQSSIVKFQSDVLSDLTGSISAPDRNGSLHAYKNLVHQARDGALEVIKQKQREASRSFQAIMKLQMKGVYHSAAELSGRGVFRAMRQYIQESLHRRGAHMFGHCRNNAQRMLEDAISAIDDRLKTQLDVTHKRVCEDYLVPHHDEFENEATLEARKQCGIELLILTKQGRQGLAEILSGEESGVVEVLPAETSLKSPICTPDKLVKLEIKEEQEADDDNDDYMLDSFFVDATQLDDESEDDDHHEYYRCKVTEVAIGQGNMPSDSEEAEMPHGEGMDDDEDSAVAESDDSDMAESEDSDMDDVEEDDGDESDDHDEDMVHVSNV